jgi:hypothetical protein
MLARWRHRLGFVLPAERLYWFCMDPNRAVAYDRRRAGHGDWPAYVDDAGVVDLPLGTDPCLRAPR